MKYRPHCGLAKHWIILNYNMGYYMAHLSFSIFVPVDEYGLRAHSRPLKHSKYLDCLSTIRLTSYFGINMSIYILTWWSGPTYELDSTYLQLPPLSYWLDGRLLQFSLTYHRAPNQCWELCWAWIFSVAVISHSTSRNFNIEIGVNDHVDVASTLYIFADHVDQDRAR